MAYLIATAFVDSKNPTLLVSFGHRFLEYLVEFVQEIRPVRQICLKHDQVSLTRNIREQQSMAYFHKSHRQGILHPLIEIGTVRRDKFLNQLLRRAGL